MSAGSNNPTLIEQQLSILNDYKKNIDKALQLINENIKYINLSTEKLSDQFHDNMPINTRKITEHIDKVNNDIEDLVTDKNLDYFVQRLEVLEQDIKDFQKYFNQIYLTTVNNDK